MSSTSTTRTARATWSNASCCSAYPANRSSVTCTTCARPPKPSSPTSLGGWRETLDYADTATLAIIDGVTSCLAYAGLDSNSGDDIAAWYNTMPRLISACGPAVVLIDHVVKSKDNRGRYAGGSMQKLALIDGISYSVDMTKPVGKGVKGTIVIKSGKDRISEIEEHCAVSWSSNGSHLREAARIEINSTDPKLMRVTIARPNMMPSDETTRQRGLERPTGSWRRSAGSSRTRPRSRPDRNHRTAEGRRVKRPEDHRAHRHQPAARRRMDQQPLRTKQPEHLRQRQTIPADERPEIGRFRGPDEQGGGERIG